MVEIMLRVINSMMILIRDYKNKYYIMKDTEKNHIDEWLVKQIKQGINTIESVSKGPRGKITLYYTGHLQKDIYNNFPGRMCRREGCR